MADFIKVSSKEEARQLAWQHYQDTGSLAGGNRYILPDGTELQIRKRISNAAGPDDLKSQNFSTKQKSDAARTARIGFSRKTVNKAIRDEAAAQWDELVGDRNATIVIGGKPYSFDKYLNKEVRDHSKLTRQKAVEAVNLGKSLGHGTPTTDVGRYAESYTQQFAETPTGNYATQDYIPPDQLERLQKAGLATSPQEAARLHVGTTKIGGRLPDVKIEELLKINPSGNLTRAGSQRMLGKAGPIAGGLAIASALMSGNPSEAIPVAAETLTPLGDLQGAPEPAVTMVNVNGKLRPLNTDTNTLMDKPGYGLEQKGGQWREVKRGTGAASKQQSRVQAEQLIPTPKPVMANTPTGVAQLKAMPKSKNIDLINEAQYFIVNPVRSAFDRIFGKRDI